MNASARIMFGATQESMAWRQNESRESTDPPGMRLASGTAQLVCTKLFRSKRFGKGPHLIQTDIPWVLFIADIWVMVSNMFYFHPYLGKISN